MKIIILLTCCFCSLVCLPSSSATVQPNSLSKQATVQSIPKPPKFGWIKQIKATWKIAKEEVNKNKKYRRTGLRLLLSTVALLALMLVFATQQEDPLGLSSRPPSRKDETFGFFIVVSFIGAILCAILSVAFLIAAAIVRGESPKTTFKEVWHLLKYNVRLPA